MPISNLALVVLLLGAAFSAALSALAARSSRQRKNGDRTDPWWGALAVGLGFVVAQVGVATPVWPLSDVTDRTPVVALVATVVASIVAGGRGLLVRIPTFLGLAVLDYLVIVGPVLGADNSEETILKLSILATSTVLAMLNLGSLDAPVRRLELSLGVLLLAGGGGIVFLLSNSFVLFLLAGSLAIVMAGSLLGGWGRAVGGEVPVAATVLSALTLNGLVYGSLDPIPAALIAAAPAVLWLLRIGPVARLEPKIRLGIALGLIAIPVGLAVGLAWLWRMGDGNI